MATQRAKTMARSTDDSMKEKVWMKKSRVAQAQKRDFPDVEPKAAQ